MTLVEMFPGESEADVRKACDAILQALCPERPRWWDPYELRGHYVCRGIRFQGRPRHFSTGNYKWSRLGGLVFERFTTLSRSAVGRAGREALHAGTDAVGDVGLLLGLLRSAA
jgi:hypothetical protein